VADEAGCVVLLAGRGHIHTSLDYLNFVSDRFSSLSFFLS